jgi:homoserine kinase
VLGGFTAAGMVDGEVRAVRFAVAPRLKFVVLIPPFEVSTPEARRLVPQSFSKADTVHSLGRAALITAAFASGDYAALRGCFDDRIHQPHRQALIPALPDVIKAGEKAGAVGGWLSGSGSTIVCATMRNPKAVAAAMRRVLPGVVRIVTADNAGYSAKVSGGR